MDAAELPGKESARCKGEESKRARRFLKVLAWTRAVAVMYTEVPVIVNPALLSNHLIPFLYGSICNIDQIQ